MKCFEFSYFLQIPLLFGTHPSLGATALTVIFISNCFISVNGVKIPFFGLWKQFAFFNTRQVDSTVFPQFVCSIPVKPIFFNQQNVRGAQKTKKGFCNLFLTSTVLCKIYFRRKILRRIFYCFKTAKHL